MGTIDLLEFLARVADALHRHHEAVLLLIRGLQICKHLGQGVRFVGCVEALAGVALHAGTIVADVAMPFDSVLHHERNAPGCAVK